MPENPQPAKRVLSRWGYWRFPVICGLAMCVLQVLLALYRFGRAPLDLFDARTWIDMGLFFLLGGLIGLLVERLLRGTTSGLRALLLVATVLAAPLSVLMGMMGGLFGPVGVVIYGILPHLLLVGIPRLIGAFWELWSKRTAR